MIRVKVILALVVAFSALGVTADAQMHEHAAPMSVHDFDPAVQRLVDRASSAAEPYADRRAAIAAGYRLVGRDLPQMGEHWLNPRLVVDGNFDIAHPQILTYLNVDGHPVLTGVVYAIPLDPGQSPPGDFGPEALWHEHNGTVDEEALLAQHHSTASAATGTRVAFLHVWIRVPASESIFGADNWAIPFVRAGLPVPSAFSDGAARAISLATGGTQFFVDLLGAAPASRANDAFEECARGSAAIVAKAKADKRGLTVDELALLDKSWSKLISKVESQSGVEAARSINGGAI